MTQLEQGDATHIFASTHYQYDTLGREVARWRDEQSGKGERFSYNSTSQLTSAIYNADNVWTGNPSNWTTRRDYNHTPDRLNWASVNDNGYLAPFASNALNQYTSINHSTPEYDIRFNLYRFDGFQYDHDAPNRLISVTGNGHSAQFTYDGLGRCVRRVLDGNTTLFTYDGWNPILEWDQSGNWRATNIYGARADEILFRSDSSGRASIYKLDEQGNVAFILNGANQIVEKYTYDAYGAPTILSGNNTQLSTSAVGNRFMFTGREYISELRIYDYRHRFYHPGIGRFIETDPTGFDAGDMNLYRYCVDDPVNLTDPDGLVARITPDHFWEGAKHWDSSNTLQGTFADRMGRFENGMGSPTDSNTSTTWRAAGNRRLEEIRQSVAREKTEMSSALGYDDETREYATSSLQRGLGVARLKDQYNDGRENVQVSDIGRGDLPERFRMIGFVLGHVKYSAQKFMDDMNRARDARMHAIITAPAPDGARTKTPVTGYYKYPDPVRPMPPQM